MKTIVVAAAGADAAIVASYFVGKRLNRIYETHNELQGNANDNVLVSYEKTLVITDEVEPQSKVPEVLPFKQAIN